MRTDKLAACHTKSTPETDTRQTPPAFFEYLQKKFKVKFTIDIAADKKNTLCKKFIDEKKNALESWWNGTAWCNPPYSKAGDFVERALRNAEEEEGTTFLLLPNRTDQKWWTLTKHAWAIVYIVGRLKFVGAKGGAPFPSVVVIFKKGYEGPPKNIYLSPTPYQRGFQRGKPKS